MKNYIEIIVMIAVVILSICGFYYGFRHGIFFGD